MGKEKALALVGSRKQQLLQARRTQASAGERFEAAVLDASTAGASQREIATHAGVSQPYIARLLGRPEKSALSGPIGKRLLERRDRVLAILREYGAENVRVFGQGTGLFTLGRMEHALSRTRSLTIWRRSSNPLSGSLTWSRCSADTVWCPRCDSNAHWAGFESAPSANWGTGASHPRLSTAARGWRGARSLRT